MAADDFASRAAKLFGSLSGTGGVEWRLNTQQGFAAGAEDNDSSEDEGARPQSLPGAAGSDEDEDDYKAKASLQYCAAFEAEAEEDEFDLLAAGQERAGQDGDSVQHLQKHMQVLDDNAYDRAHQCMHDRQPQLHPSTGKARGTLQQQQQQQQQQHQLQQQPLSGFVAAHTEGSQGLPPATTATHECQEQQQHTGGSDSTLEQRAKRAKPSGGVWVPPHRRPDYRPPDRSGEQPLPQQQQQHQQGPGSPPQPQRRRVTFSDSAVQRSHSSDTRHQQGQRGGLGRSRARGRGVPDHVANPQRYTVYTLDEPLFVGQGGGDVELEAAANSWQQQRQLWKGSKHELQQEQQHDGVQPHGKASQLDTSRRETAQPVEALRVGAAASSADVADMDVEAAPEAPPAPPSTGAIKFAPTGRLCKVAKVKQQPVPGAARGAFMDEEAVDGGSEADNTATQPAGSRGRARQYRSRQVE